MVTTHFTLHITITGSTDPRLQHLMNILAIAASGETGAETEVTEETKSLIGLEEVVTFMHEQLPDASKHKVRQRARKFYGALFHWTVCERLSLRFYCPFCEERLGICRCPRLGSQSGSRPTGWYYENNPQAASWWRLDSDSIADVTPFQVGSVHRATSQQLEAFIAYLKQTP